MELVGTRSVPTKADFDRALNAIDIGVAMYTLLKDVATIFPTAGSNTIIPVSLTLTAETIAGITLAGTGKVIVAGTSSAPVVNDTANVKFIQLYFDCGATSGTSVGLYVREYITGAGGSNAVTRFYSDVVGVTASTAQGMQCSLGFGESTTTGSVSGLGVAGRFQIGLADIAYPGTGTLAVVQSEIYSFGAASDPAGNNIAMYGVVNDGHADGMANVDDDAVLFHFRGWTVADANMISVDNTPAAMPSAVYSIRVKMPDNSLAYLYLGATPVTA